MRKHLKRLTQLVAAACVCVAVQAQPTADFFKAVAIDDAQTLRSILAGGFDANAIDARGQTALHLALRDESPRVVEALLAQPGLRIDAVNANDETPLMLAALRGNRAVVETLMARGARINRPGWTPLHYAASGPDPRIVGLLLDRGADIEAPSPNRTTPLMMGARYGAQGVAELLLQRGADPRKRNDAGKSAADFAQMGGRDYLVKVIEQAAR